MSVGVVYEHNGSVETHSHSSVDLPTTAAVAVAVAVIQDSSSHIKQHVGDEWRSVSPVSQRTRNKQSCSVPVLGSFEHAAAAQRPLNLCFAYTAFYHTAHQQLQQQQQWSCAHMWRIHTHRATTSLVQLALPVLFVNLTHRGQQYSTVQCVLL